MKSEEYVYLTAEQRFQIMQRDLPQIAKDVARYQRLNKISELLGDIFIEVNSWWKRPLNRHKEDYDFAAAYIAYDKVKNGRFDAVKSQRELLDDLLVPFQDAIKKTAKKQGIKMAALSGRDGAGLQEILQTKYHLKNGHNTTQDAGFEAIAFFGDSRHVEDYLVQAAYAQKHTPLLQQELEKKANFLRKTLILLGAEEQDFGDKAQEIAWFYGQHQKPLAQLHGKSDADKIHILNAERLRLAEKEMQLYADRSLRPEARYVARQSTRQGQGFAQNTAAGHKQNGGDLPKVVPLIKELKQIVQTSKFYQKAAKFVQKPVAAVKRFWAAPANRRRTILALALGTVAYGGYKASENVFNKAARINYVVPVDPSQPVGYRMLEGSWHNQEYYDENLEMDHEGNPVVYDIFNQSASHATQPQPTEAVILDTIPRVVLGKNSIVPLLVNQEDLTRLEEEYKLYLLDQKLNDNRSDLAHQDSNENDIRQAPLARKPQ